MRTSAAGLLIAVAMMLLFAGVVSAQQQIAQHASKVWTDDDVKTRIRFQSHRKVTDAELAGIIARQYVSPPVWPAGPVSVETTWTPDDDRPDRGRMPRWYLDDHRRYAQQPLWTWPYWTPYAPVILSGPRDYPQQGRRR